MHQFNGFEKKSVLPHSSRIYKMKPSSGIFMSEKDYNLAGFDKVQLKSDGIPGEFVNGTRTSILYNFALDKLPHLKVIEKLKNRLYRKKMNVTSVKVILILKLITGEKLIFMQKH